jgi:hypothetical protein
MEVSANLATVITVACWTLHNFLLSTNPQTDLVWPYLQNKEGKVSGGGRSFNRNTVGRFPRPTAQELEIRNAFADWFISPAGSLPFQNDVI